MTFTGAPAQEEFIRGPRNAKDFVGTHMLTIGCIAPQCGIKVRIGRIIDHGRQKQPIGAFQFCPQCGGPASAFHDTESSYWDTLARSYKLPVSVIKLIYEEWDPTEHNNFSDFVAEMQASDE